MPQARARPSWKGRCGWWQPAHATRASCIRRPISARVRQRRNDGSTRSGAIACSICVPSSLRPETIAAFSLAWRSTAIGAGAKRADKARQPSRSDQPRLGSQAAHVNVHPASPQAISQACHGHGSGAHWNCRWA
jgi:hypothetical protein